MLIIGILLYAGLIIFDFKIFKLGSYGILNTLYLSVFVVVLSYKLGRIHFLIECSFGMYLYHMIVVNVFLELGLKGSYILLIATYLITFLIAFASLRLVQKPFAEKIKRSV
jgi:peptidoglycan/LPS O-acetylase OafA/YrhL